MKGYHQITTWLRWYKTGSQEFYGKPAGIYFCHDQKDGEYCYGPYKTPEDAEKDCLRFLAEGVLTAAIDYPNEGQTFDKKNHDYDERLEVKLPGWRNKAWDSMVVKK